MCSRSQLHNILAKLAVCPDRATISMLYELEDPLITGPDQKYHDILPSCQSSVLPNTRPCMCTLASLLARCSLSYGTTVAQWGPPAQLPFGQLFASPPASASQHLPTSSISTVTVAGKAENARVTMSVASMSTFLFAYNCPIITWIMHLAYMHVICAQQIPISQHGARRPL